MAGSDAARFGRELTAKVGTAGGPERKAEFVALLQTFLGPKRRAVLVGGGLVEFYTNGAYTTGDIDLVGDREAIGALLRGAGFEESGRYFFSEELELAVEVPNSSLRPTESEIEIRVRTGSLFAVSPEDALVDRLLASKFWRSATDWEQAILLWASVGDRMDTDALRSKAKANEVLDELERLLAEVARAAKT